MVPNGRALLQAVEELRPDVVITDISMPELNGLDAGEQIKQKNRSIKLVYLTVSLDPDLAAEAFRRGASAYVLKQCEAEELRIAVRRVLSGASYLSPLVTRETVEFRLRSGARYQRDKQISSRRREVLLMLAEGNTLKEIAYTLHIKLGTVAFHTRNPHGECWSDGSTTESRPTSQDRTQCACERDSGLFLRCGG